MLHERAGVKRGFDDEAAPCGSEPGGGALAALTLGRCKKRRILPLLEAVPAI